MVPQELPVKLGTLGSEEGEYDRSVELGTLLVWSLQYRPGVGPDCGWTYPSGGTSVGDLKTSSREGVVLPTGKES